jgi:hypothetical protein
MAQVFGVGTGTFGFSSIVNGFVPGVQMVDRAIVADTDDGVELSGGSADTDDTHLIVDAVGEHIAFRFTDLPYQQGATVSDARITLKLGDTSKNDAEGTWYAHDTDDSQTIQHGVDGDIDGRTKTTASVAWTTNDLGSSGDLVSPPSLSTLIQEVVDRPGWEPGNNITLIYAHNSAADKLDVIAFDLDQGGEATFYSEYRLIPQVVGVATGFFGFTGTATGVGGLPPITPNTLDASSTFFNPTLRHQLYPDAILVQTGLTGSLTDIDDDPDAPDGSWLTTTAGTDTDLRVSFPSPGASLTGGAGLQEFRVLVRATGEVPNPQVRLELWEAGAFVSTLVANTEVTSTTGTVISGTWDSTGRTASDIELRIVGTSA